MSARKASANPQRSADPPLTVADLRAYVAERTQREPGFNREVVSAHQRRLMHALARPRGEGGDASASR